MTTFDNDIGRITYTQGSETISFPDPWPVATKVLPKVTQTRQATYKGELRLPFMYRSFISFSFGGRYIEDFGIIRVTGDDRLEQDLFSSFNDLTQEYDVVDGQFYWETHLNPLELRFTLSTDQMTQRQIDDFKAWFAPGKIRQLVLAQHPNRAILARVSAPPRMSMLPFKGSQKKMIGGTEYQINTTIYKGDIQLNFISEDPYWYSICNLLGERYRVLKNYETGQEQASLDSDSGQPLTDQQYFQYRWYDANNNLVGVLKDMDALKIILQDNIPSANMINIHSNLFLGGDVIVLDYQLNSEGDLSVSALVGQHKLKISNINNDDDDDNEFEDIIFTLPTVDVDDFNEDKIDFYLNNNVLTVVYKDNNQEIPMVNVESQKFKKYTKKDLKVQVIKISDNPPNAMVGLSRIGISYAPATGQTSPVPLSCAVGDNEKDNIAYLYYAGNAPSYPMIEFTLKPILNQAPSEIPYIKYPKNKWYNEQYEPENKNYNYIAFQSSNRQQFRFSLPSAWAGYNQALYWFNKLGNIENEEVRVGASIQDAKIYIRDYVNHPAARAWALNILEQLENSDSQAQSSIEAKRIIDKAKNQLASNQVSLSDIYDEMKKFLYNSNNILSAHFKFDLKTGVSKGTFSFNTANNNSTIIKTEENVGDMVKSNYLFLQEANQPDANGKIMPWSDASQQTKKYTYKITTDYPSDNGEAALTNFNIRYKNMYR